MKNDVLFLRLETTTLFAGTLDICVQLPKGAGIEKAKEWITANQEDLLETYEWKIADPGGENDTVLDDIEVIEEDGDEGEGDDEVTIVLSLAADGKLVEESEVTE